LIGQAEPEAQMFQFLFKYPVTVFTKGHLVLLSPWPVWLLMALILAAAGGLALLIHWRLRRSGGRLPNQRAIVIWAMQSALLALLLLLLWQPAIRIAELNSQQNIIAVVVDDSRSMSIADSDGKTREASAVAALEGGVLAGLQKRFETRVYTLGSELKRANTLSTIAPVEAATHISEGLKQLASDTAELPIGAIVLLSDGGQNSVGVGGSDIGPDALQSLQNRRVPVHTVGFGVSQHKHDIEIEDVNFPSIALPNARISATVTLTQHGYSGQQAKLIVREEDKVVAEREITLAPEGLIQAESLFFAAGPAGAKSLAFGLEPLAGEENLANNSITRPLLVSDAKRRVLYVEGEPRWEYKFIRRAEEDDPTVQLVCMLRTSENKVYRQGIQNVTELADGFPVRPEDLFGYEGIVIGSVAADYFTPMQQELLREYVERRGGGILFLGGSSSLSDGGWGTSSLNELLPTVLPSGRHNFHRNPATVELTATGKDSPITRLLDDPEKNTERWRKLTYLADYEDPGSPKAGATELVDLRAGPRKLPLLITESYGHGRTAILATGGTWRWQMSEALGDRSHDLFWRQLLRWLVGESPGHVAASMTSRLLMDDGRIQLTAQVRDQTFHAATDAHVTAHIIGLQGLDERLELPASSSAPGTYQTDWNAEKPGAYLAELVAESSGDRPQELGRDVLTFQREDGVAEGFHTEQNKPLLEQLAKETGGRYWQPSELKNLSRDISYSEAGISVLSTKELWNMPIAFLLLLGLPIAEWLLRRKWGLV
jgi:uncharacterized membrane protein